MGEPVTEIRGGIEFEVADGPPGMDPWCARCGSSAFHEECDRCGGDGFIEDEPWDHCGDGEVVTCPECRGSGGWWCCCSSRAWCEAHPLPGREGIESTASGSDGV